ncbi:phosphoglycerate dehydrogenase [Shumkonia mesophila]|uniref:phosphoglycerate dehydrogenase n=1 Tax=Shumkonia mesophila TaxID=2838854 RepID=UPI002934B230|nr:phosphoglycerate dehydrogenase [Shumkonia mesophila]
MMRIAVCEPAFGRHPVLKAELLALYPDATLNEGGRVLAGDALIGFLKGHQGAIVGAQAMNDAVFTAVPELTVVSKWGVGLDTIDLGAMARHGVRLGWTGGVNRLSVAELALSFFISLLRQVPAASRDVRGGLWRRRIGRHLSGRTVGIVGCGHIGKEVVRLLVPFGCRVLAHDIRDYPAFYAAHGVEAVELEDLLKTADVVSLHVPLDATTRGMIDAGRLALMRPDAVLVNTARGGIVDESALREALSGGRLAAAACDAFATEPPTDADLLALPNFLATPHIGGSAEEAILAMGRGAIAGLADNAVPDPATGNI